MCKYNYGCHCCGFFKVREDVEACDCSQGLGNRKRICTGRCSVKIILRCSGVSNIVDRFYVALFFAIEQTHCAILRYRNRLTALFFAIEQTHCAILRYRADSLRYCRMRFWISDRSFLFARVFLVIHQNGVLTKRFSCYV